MIRYKVPSSAPSVRTEGGPTSYPVLRLTEGRENKGVREKPILQPQTPARQFHEYDIGIGETRKENPVTEPVGAV